MKLKIEGYINNYLAVKLSKCALFPSNIWETIHFVAKFLFWFYDFCKYTCHHMGGNCPLTFYGFIELY